MARLKFSISLEKFKILNFFNLWALRETNTCRKNFLGNEFFCANTCGVCIRTRANTENIFEEVFAECFAKFFGEFTWCEYMPHLCSHPCEYRKIFLANYLCIGFVPGGNQMRASVVQERQISPFHFMGSRHSVNERIAKEFYRKDNSLKSFRPFSASPDSKN